MELRHLRYFVAVAEAMHFTRAAEKLHIAQPPLSQQIQALEAELGTPLFVREKRRIRLTPAGERFLERARRILEAASAAADEVRRVAAGEVGELGIGFTPSLPFTSLLPGLLHDYRHAFPQVRLALHEMFTDRQLDALRDGRIDVGFVRFTGLDAPVGIALDEIRRDPLRLVVNERHALAATQSVAMAQLRDDDFVAFPEGIGTGLRSLTRQLCHAVGFEPRIVQDATEVTTQIGLVAAGIGVAVLPAPLECIQLPGVRYLPITDAAAHMSLGVARRQEVPSSLLRRFLALLDGRDGTLPVVLSDQ